jgi:hypothetical protein
VYRVFRYPYEVIAVRASLSWTVVLPLVLSACHQGQTPEQARAGFAALFARNDAGDPERFTVTQDPETARLLAALVSRLQHIVAPPPPRSADLPAPQAGLMAMLSEGIVKTELPALVSESREGSRLVQRYANGSSLTFRLVGSDWKIDLDAGDGNGRSLGSRLKEALDSLDKGAPPSAGSP